MSVLRSGVLSLLVPCMVTTRAVYKVTHEVTNGVRDEHVSLRNIHSCQCI